MNVLDELRAFWDADAQTYDADPTHQAKTATEQAAWAAALARSLPEAPARVLDVGAGTGFLSLPLARLGHEVTALDLSSSMLARLEEKSQREGLPIHSVQGSAHDPPAGPFDAVVERHLVWTLPDPSAALAAWRAVAPRGRLLLVEEVMLQVDRFATARQIAREALRRKRTGQHAHHDSYGEGLMAQLPLARRMAPEYVLREVEAAGWRAGRVERLRDVEWARALPLNAIERLVGVQPLFLVTAQA